MTCVAYGLLPVLGAELPMPWMQLCCSTVAACVLTLCMALRGVRLETVKGWHRTRIRHNSSRKVYVTVAELRTTNQVEGGAKEALPHTHQHGSQAGEPRMACLACIDSTFHDLLPGFGYNTLDSMCVYKPNFQVKCYLMRYGVASEVSG